MKGEWSRFRSCAIYRRKTFVAICSMSRLISSAPTVRGILVRQARRPRRLASTWLGCANSVESSRFTSRNLSVATSARAGSRRLRISQPISAAQSQAAPRVGVSITATTAGPPTPNLDDLSTCAGSGCSTSWTPWNNKRLRSLQSGLANRGRVGQADNRFDVTAEDRWRGRRWLRARRRSAGPPECGFYWRDASTSGWDAYSGGPALPLRCAETIRHGGHRCHGQRGLHWPVWPTLRPSRDDDFAPDASRDSGIQQ